MAKTSDKKTVKKVETKKPVAQPAKAAPAKVPTKTASKKEDPIKNAEKALAAGLDSQVEYAFEDDSKSKKSAKSGKGKDKPKPKPTKVEQGLLVSVEYVGKLKNGEEFDNSKTHGPIQFVVGNGQVIKGFDKAVLGMKIGDKKKFTIPKVDAYGDANPQLVQVVPLSKVPDHIKSQLKVGGFLVMQSPVGQQVPAKVVKLDKVNVSLDMNHPLAGQDLTFEIKLVDIDHAPEGGSCGCGDGSCGDDCGDGDCGDSCDCGHDHK
jgi:peptidylprolyl isomerase